jgi:hypothetical protein
LRGSNSFQTFRVGGRRLVRQQALAMAKTSYPRPLTESMAKLLQAALGPPPEYAAGAAEGKP